MPKWSPRYCVGLFVRSRAFSTYTHEQVQVRTGSVGHVSVDLFNLSTHAPDSPLIVHLPPFPSNAGGPPTLPDFLQRWPVASINYRWESSHDAAPSEKFSQPLSWPTPVHDVAFAYAWLVENLAPPGNGRRDLFIYGSYLGGSLAASLGLTEAHTHAPFGARGFIAYNGIYNWTMFLPDHRINQPARRAKTFVPSPEPPEGSHLRALHGQLSPLFQAPCNLFDPFASPSLFFHGPGLNVPESFAMSAAKLNMIDALAQLGSNEGAIPTQNPPKPPRKSYLVFPPRKSTLKIPRTLLLHDAPSQPPPGTGKPRKRKAKASRHTFRAQAQELGDFMRRSINKVELKERIKWDDEMDSWDEEAQRRVRVVELGEESDDYELSRDGQEVVSSWLEDME